jgi:hypothetical protein
VGVELEVDIATVLVNVGFPEDGLKVTDVPLGRPEAERLTVWVEPLTSVTVTVAVTLPPCWVDPLLGLTEIEKSNGWAKLAVWVIGPFIVIVAGLAVPV